MDTYKTCKQIVENAQIVENVFKAPFFNDEPQFYTYSAILKDKAIPSDILGGGTSFDERSAYIKSVMEAIERYSLIPTEQEIEKWEKITVKQIEKQCQYSLSEIIKFSPEQLSQPKFKDFNLKNKNSKFNCCKVIDLLKDEEVYFPAQFFYLPYWEKEKILRLPISTGSASDFDLDTVVKKGIYEVFERDEFITSYLGKIPGKKILLEKLPTKIQKIIDEFNFYNLVPHCVLLNSDLPIPTVLTILEDPTGIGPLYTLGMKCSPDITTCLKGSLEEAFHSRRWLRFSEKDSQYMTKLWKNTTEISDILDRGLIWSSQKTKGRLDFWIRESEPISFTKLKANEKKYTLKELLNILKNRDWHCYVKTFQNQNLSEFNIQSIKVFIPEAHPLYLDENYPYWDKKRIREVLNSSKSVEINKFIQPFL